MIAIILGIWALTFLLGFTEGMVKSYVNNAVENEISHIQIHDSLFLEDKESKYFMQGIGGKLEKIRVEETVAATTSRMLVNGMLSSSKGGARGVLIRGVNPEREASVTNLDQKIIEGSYFAEGKKNQLLVSERQAEKLKLKLRSKIVLTFQDKDSEITAAAFRVAGIYKSGNGLFDEMNVFMREKDLNKYFGGIDLAHEIAIALKDAATLEESQLALKAAFPKLKVENYREISPDVQLYESQINTSAAIFVVIIMLALAFGIINTMLMAVLERYRELGVLMAIGMNKLRVFSMIVLETILLALVAVVPGLLIGFLTVSYFGKKGIDLSAFSRGMQQFGMADKVYTSLNINYYILFAVAVGITAIIGSLYPAYKAIRLKPMDAIRKI